MSKHLPPCLLQSLGEEEGVTGEHDLQGPLYRVPPLRSLLLSVITWASDMPSLPICKTGIIIPTPHVKVN